MNILEEEEEKENQPKEEILLKIITANDDEIINGITKFLQNNQNKFSIWCNISQGSSFCHELSNTKASVQEYLNQIQKITNQPINQTNLQQFLYAHHQLQRQLTTRQIIKIITTQDPFYSIPTTIKWIYRKFNNPTPPPNNTNQENQIITDQNQKIQKEILNTIITATDEEIRQGIIQYLIRFKYNQSETEQAIALFLEINSTKWPENNNKENITNTVKTYLNQIQKITNTPIDKLNTKQFLEAHHQLQTNLPINQITKLPTTNAIKWIYTKYIKHQIKQNKRKERSMNIIEKYQNEQEQETQIRQSQYQQKIDNETIQIIFKDDQQIFKEVCEYLISKNAQYLREQNRKTNEIIIPIAFYKCNVMENYIHRITQLTNIPIDQLTKEQLTHANQKLKYQLTYNQAKQHLNIFQLVKWIYKKYTHNK